MITRDYSEVPLDGGENPPKKITIKYKTTQCSHSGMEAKAGQLELLRFVIDNPSLLDCGLVPFQNMAMKHDGTVWVLTLDAKV